MASIFPCFTVTARHHSIIFSSFRPSFLVKTTSQFHSLRSHASLVLNNNASLSKVARENRGFLVHSLVVWARIDVAIAAIRPGGSVESDKLPADIRKRVMDAVDACGGRVTIGDVAIKAGLKLNEAQKALQALAADTSGFLEVSDEGDVLYVLPKDYRSKLTAKSFRMKVEPFVEKAKSAAEYLVRVSFGTALFASIGIVYTAIIALASESDGDIFPFGNFDMHNRGRRGGKSYNSGTGIHRQCMQVDDVRMNFIEAVFSFVFGDGDPNQGIEEERWKLIGEYIASKGGVVTAEELAPYLHLETANDMGDDSYILPVLLQFDGQPEVDEEGNILYQFPSLQRTAYPQRSGRQKYVGSKWADWVGGIEKFLMEKKLQFSKASTSERAMVIVLGGLNLFGVVILGTMLKNIAVKPSGFITFVSVIFPLLQIYAAIFFAIPLVRWFLVRKKNDEIERRNSAREQCARALELPDLSLKRKLLSARDMVQRTFIGQERIVYSSDKDLFDLDYEAQEWDQRFREIEKSD